MYKITTPFPSHNHAIIRRRSAATGELTGFVDAVDEDALLSSFVSTSPENLQEVERASHALCFMLVAINGVFKLWWQLFYKLHEDDFPSDPVTYRAINRFYTHNRVIYFTSDTYHLVKTTQN